MLGQRVDDSNLSCLLGKCTDAVAGLVLPPRNGEVGVPVAVGICGWDVEEATLWAHELLRTSLGVDESFWL